jgi:UDP-GlcNAc3NAcA epimerase
MYDSVLYYKDKILLAPAKYQTKGIPKDFLLVTIHRAENTDNIQNLVNIFSALSEVSFPVVMPIHPRTAKMISGNIIVSPNIIITEPVSYLQMLKLTMDAMKVVTDSGGLQKEAYFLGRPCITIRNETEWIETLHDGWNILTGTTPDKIKQAILTSIPTAEKRNKFGNGRAAELIVENLKYR